MAGGLAGTLTGKIAKEAVKRYNEAKQVTGRICRANAAAAWTCSGVAGRSEDWKISKDRRLLPLRKVRQKLPGKRKPGSAPV